MTEHTTCCHCGQIIPGTPVMVGNDSLCECCAEEETALCSRCGERIYRDDNHLWYSGEMDDGQESGKGAWYYNNGQVMYEGEFKKGKQSGKGSYYDENGNLIYSGEWENGDYAH